MDLKSARTASLPSIPTSLGAASLSCLAAEHHQIHDQQALDAWKTKAISTVDELYEQKASLLRHEEHMRALLAQLRAIIDEDLPRQETVYAVEDNRVRHIAVAANVYEP